VPAAIHARSDPINAVPRSFTWRGRGWKALLPLGAVAYTRHVNAQPGDRIRLADLELCILSKQPNSFFVVRDNPINRVICRIRRHRYGQGESG